VILKPEEMGVGEYMLIERSSTIPTHRVKQGWHWCDDWDDMLIGPGMDALVGCTCKWPALEPWKVEAAARVDEANARMEAAQKGSDK
jgi:hypothetical protein